MIAFSLTNEDQGSIGQFDFMMKEPDYKNLLDTLETKSGRLSHTVSFAMFGAVFGAMFPLVAVGILYQEYGFGFWSANIADEVRSLFRIIMLAPLVCGIFGLFIGHKKDQLVGLLRYANSSFSKSSAESAEIIRQLEDKNLEMEGMHLVLQQEQTRLAESNFYAATLVFEIEEKNESLEKAKKELANEHDVLVSELIAARDIQLMMLPRMPLVHGRLQVSAVYCPCDAMSGDFYDCIVVKNQLFVMVVDITGHGTKAAQITYLLKGLLKDAVLATPNGDLRSIYSKLSQDYAQFGLNFNACVHLFRADPDLLEFEYCSCGVPLGVQLDADGTVKTLDTFPMPVLSRDPTASQFYSYKGNLSPGENIYLYTDGCYELDAIRKFSEKKFLKILSRLRGPWEEKILSELKKVNGEKPFQDDVTILKISVSNQMSHDKSVHDGFKTVA